MKTKILYLLSISLILSATFVVSANSQMDAQRYEVNNDNTSSEILESLKDTEPLNSVEEYINNLELPATPKSSYPKLSDYPDEAAKAYSLGFEAVPEILDWIDNSEDNGYKEAFLMSVVTQNLHLYNMVGALEGTVGVVSLDKDAYTPKWYAAQLREYAKKVPENIEKILDSNMSYGEKLVEIDKMGMLAVPYLVNKINEGQPEWLKSVELQVLGSGTEYVDLLREYSDKTHAEIYEEKLTKIDKDFDAVKWINENEDKLELLFTLYN